MGNVKITGNVKIISVLTGKYFASDKEEDNTFIYATGNSNSALVFKSMPDDSFELVYKEPISPIDNKPKAKLWLSFQNGNKSWVKLYHNDDDARYRINNVTTDIPTLKPFTIFDKSFQQYMWVDGTEPRVTGGNFPDARAWFYFEPVPANGSDPSNADALKSGK